MANLFQTAGDWFAKRVASYLNDDRGQGYSLLGNYYSGDHRPQLKVNYDKVTGKAQDDNIVQNFVGLAVDRSVSRLWKGGVKWKLPEPDVAPDMTGQTDASTQQGAMPKMQMMKKAKPQPTEQEDYLDKVWDLNKKEILLYQVGLHGAIYGTAYFKVCPDELTDPYTNEVYPRLVALDPEVVRIRTEPQDMNEVLLYQIKYDLPNNATHWEITRRADVQFKFDNAGQAVVVPSAVVVTEDAQAEQAEAKETWVVEEYEQSKTYGNQVTLISTTPWGYDFPPIIHWKNLPSLKSCYGDSDIDDAINIQDKSNFVTSNIGKIIKFYAHPQTVGTGFKVSEMQNVEASVGTFRAIPNENAKVFNLEMSSNLDSSHAFGLSLRQSIFDIAREVDMTSVADKIGTLTNFGLRVLWGDALDKNDTKRQLYGDALKELNRRILVLKGYAGENSNPGDIQWGEALPINILEEMQTDQLALSMGIIDKQTVAERYQTRFGADWEDIQANLSEQANQDNAQNANIGAQILKNFSKGGGAEQMPPKPGAQQSNAQPLAKMPVVREMSATGKMSNNSG